MAGTGTSASSTPLHTNQASTGSLQVRDNAGVMSAGYQIARTILTVVATTGTGTGGALVGTDEVNVVILPPKCTLILGLSTLILSATQGANTEIDLGYRAYVDINGNTIVEDPDGVYNGYDASVITQVLIGSGGGGALGTLADVSGNVVFDNKEPITLFLTALDAGGTFDGDLADTYGFTLVYVTE